MNHPEIRFVKNQDIDYTKWDRCISASSVPLIYAQSWYLDMISPGWGAFVWGDYTHVMPLNVKRKLGFSVLLQPIFAQQQGIFPEAEPKTQHKFLTKVYDQFNYVAIQLSSAHSDCFPEGFSVQQRKNLILNLSPAYDELKSGYSQHTRRQIRKAAENKVSVIKGIPTSEYMELKRLSTSGKLSKQSMQTLKRIVDFSLLHGNGTIYAAYNNENTLCSAAFFLKSGNRVTYLNAASNEEGKRTCAMHLIVDQFISEHAGSALTLDFEGSSIPGIARFYEGFGAVPETYFFLKSNRLPIPIRWLKK